LAGIDRRVRAREVQRWRRERESETLRARRLQFLQELSGRIDAGFTAMELLDAEAALLRTGTVDARQRDLPLPGGH
jgi:hypothetical protein